MNPLFFIANGFSAGRYPVGRFWVVEVNPVVVSRRFLLLHHILFRGHRF